MGYSRTDLVNTGIRPFAVKRVVLQCACICVMDLAAYTISICNAQPFENYLLFGGFDMTCYGRPEVIVGLPFLLHALLSTLSVDISVQGEHRV